MAADARAHLQERVLDLDDKEHYSDTSRIKSLSDGVFSIAMTLLAFTLIVDLNDQPAFTVSTFLDRFGIPLLVYAMSFVVLGVYWISHAIQFHYVVRADRPLMVRTILFLVFVSLVPFTAHFFGTYPLDRIAVAVYGLNLALCGVMLLWTLTYATKDPLMLHRAMDRRIFRALRAAYVSGPLIYLVAIAVAFVNERAAFWICVAVPIVTFFPNPFWGRFYARFIGNRSAAIEEEAHEKAERL